MVTSSRPSVSIVIPVHGKWAYTRKCLLSLNRQVTSVPFEVIVVDDCSPDDTGRLVAASEGVRLVRNEVNLGFGGACNAGARAARGGFLIFLNNDTQVEPGWLDALVTTAETDESIGLVGSKLVLPDGRLQESGGIVWSDGSAHNYGRGGDPSDPLYNVVRDVDYCSGAAVLVRAHLFEKLGGFDDRYAPAYYEDVDLAFAVREAGFRTVVQPAAVVVHHEGVSNGTDTARGVKRFQEINRPKFAEKWAGPLAEHRAGPSDTNLWAGRQRTAQGHGGGVVLVVDLRLPRPDQDAGSVRMAAILDELVGLGQRVLFLPADGELPERYTTPLQQRGITVLGDWAQWWAVLRAVAPELQLAVLCRPTIAWRVLGDLRAQAPHCTVVYDTVDLHFLREQRRAELVAELGRAEEAFGLSRQADATRELELAMVRASDITLVVSHVEREVLREIEPGADVRILSIIHQVSTSPLTPAGRSGLIFVGCFLHTPNCDAAEWLAREIMPVVRKSVPDAELHIVGSDPSPEITALGGPGVVVHGWVESLEPLYDTVRVAVAPMRYGAGVKGKVGESASLGVPTVGTTIAFEGMALQPGRDVLLGDTVEDLAAEIVALLTDDELWRRVSASGRSAIAEHFGSGPARELLRSLVEQDLGRRA